ncbi:hypothetical protein PCE1_000098 [Barthelona sp. PCE]
MGEDPIILFDSLCIDSSFEQLVEDLQKCGDDIELFDVRNVCLGIDAYNTVKEIVRNTLCDDFTILKDIEGSVVEFLNSFHLTCKHIRGLNLFKSVIDEKSFLLSSFLFGILHLLDAPVVDTLVELIAHYISNDFAEDEVNCVLQLNELTFELSDTEKSIEALRSYLFSLLIQIMKQNFPAFSQMFNSLNFNFFFKDSFLTSFIEAIESSSLLDKGYHIFFEKTKNTSFIEFVFSTDITLNKRTFMYLFIGLQISKPIATDEFYRCLVHRTDFEGFFEKMDLLTIFKHINDVAKLDESVFDFLLMKSKIDDLEIFQFFFYTFQKNSLLESLSRVRGLETHDAVYSIFVRQLLDNQEFHSSVDFIFFFFRHYNSISRYYDTFIELENILIDQIVAFNYPQLSLDNLLFLFSINSSLLVFYQGYQLLPDHETALKAKFIRLYNEFFEFCFNEISQSNLEPLCYLESFHRILKESEFSCFVSEDHFNLLFSKLFYLIDSKENKHVTMLLDILTSFFDVFLRNECIPEFNLNHDSEFGFEYSSKGFHINFLECHTPLHHLHRFLPLFNYFMNVKSNTTLLSHVLQIIFPSFCINTIDLADELTQLRVCLILNVYFLFFESFSEQDLQNITKLLNFVVKSDCVIINGLCQLGLFSSLEFVGPDMSQRIVCENRPRVNQFLSLTEFQCSPNNISEFPMVILAPNHGLYSLLSIEDNVIVQRLLSMACCYGISHLNTNRLFRLYNFTENSLCFPSFLSHLLNAYNRTTLTQDQYLYLEPSKSVTFGTESLNFTSQLTLFLSFIYFDSNIISSENIYLPIIKCDFINYSFEMVLIVQRFVLLLCCKSLDGEKQFPIPIAKRFSPNKEFTLAITLKTNPFSLAVVINGEIIFQNVFDDVFYLNDPHIATHHSINNSTEITINPNIYPVLPEHTNDNVEKRWLLKNLLISPDFSLDYCLKLSDMNDMYLSNFLNIPRSFTLLFFIKNQSLLVNSVNSMFQGKKDDTVHCLDNKDAHVVDMLGFFDVSFIISNLSTVLHLLYVNSNDITSYRCLELLFRLPEVKDHLLRDNNRHIMSEMLFPITADRKGVFDLTLDHLQCFLSILGINYTLETLERLCDMECNVKKELLRLSTHSSSINIELMNTFFSSSYLLSCTTLLDDLDYSSTIFTHRIGFFNSLTIFTLLSSTVSTKLRNEDVILPILQGFTSGTVTHVHPHVAKSLIFFVRRFFPKTLKNLTRILQFLTDMTVVLEIEHPDECFMIEILENENLFTSSILSKYTIRQSSRFGFHFFRYVFLNNLRSILSEKRKFLNEEQISLLYNHIFINCLRENMYVQGEYAKIALFLKPEFIAAFTLGDYISLLDKITKNVFITKDFINMFCINCLENKSEDFPIFAKELNEILGGLGKVSGYKPQQVENKSENEDKAIKLDFDILDLYYNLFSTQMVYLRISINDQCKFEYYLDCYLSLIIRSCILLKFEHFSIMDNNTPLISLSKQNFSIFKLKCIKNLIFSVMRAYDIIFELYQLSDSNSENSRLMQILSIDSTLCFHFEMLCSIVDLAITTFDSIDEWLDHFFDYFHLTTTVCTFTRTFTNSIVRKLFDIIIHSVLRPERKSFLLSIKNVHTLLALVTRTLFEQINTPNDATKVELGFYDFLYHNVANAPYNYCDFCDALIHLIQHNVIDLLKHNIANEVAKTHIYPFRKPKVFPNNNTDIDPSQSWSNELTKNNQLLSILTILKKIIFLNLYIVQQQDFFDLENNFNIKLSVRKLIKRLFSKASVFFKMISELTEFLKAFLYFMECILAKSYYTLTKLGRDKLENRKLKTQQIIDIFFSHVDILFDKGIFESYELMEFMDDLGAREDITLKQTFFLAKKYKLVFSKNIPIDFFDLIIKPLFESIKDTDRDEKIHTYCYQNISSIWTLVIQLFNESKFKKSLARSTSKDVAKLILRNFKKKFAFPTAKTRIRPLQRVKKRNQGLKKVMIPSSILHFNLGSHLNFRVPNDFPDDSELARSHMHSTEEPDIKSIFLTDELFCDFRSIAKDWLDVFEHEVLLSETNALYLTEGTESYQKVWNAKQQRILDLCLAQIMNASPICDPTVLRTVHQMRGLSSLFSSVKNSFLVYNDANRFYPTPQWELLPLSKHSGTFQRFFATLSPAVTPFLRQPELMTDPIDIKHTKELPDIALNLKKISLRFEHEVIKATVIMRHRSICGTLFANDEEFMFIPNDLSLSTLGHCSLFTKDDVKTVEPRRYQSRNTAFEVFFTSGYSLLLSFYDAGREAFTTISKLSIFMIRKKPVQTEEKSNFNSLMVYNRRSERSFMDRGRGFVFPVVLSNAIDTNELREMTKVMGAITHEPNVWEWNWDIRGEMINYQVPSEFDSYYFSNCYCPSSLLLHYYGRMLPFIDDQIMFQGGKLDAPSRQLNSVRRLTTAAKHGMFEADPLLFYNPEVLMNFNSVIFDVKNSNYSFDVELPLWSENNSRLFVSRHAQLLNCLDLSPWLDLIFGVNSRGQNAKKNINIYHPICYDDFDIDDVAKDEGIREIMHHESNNYGTVPKKIFDKPVRRQSVVPKHFSKENSLNALLYPQYYKCNIRFLKSVYRYSNKTHQIISHDENAFSHLVVEQGLLWLVNCDTKANVVTDRTLLKVVRANLEKVLYISEYIIAMTKMMLHKYNFNTKTLETILLQSMYFDSEIVGVKHVTDWDLLIVVCADGLLSTIDFNTFKLVKQTQLSQLHRFLSFTTAQLVDFTVTCIDVCQRNGDIVVVTKLGEQSSLTLLSLNLRHIKTISTHIYSFAMVHDFDTNVEDYDIIVTGTKTGRIAVYSTEKLQELFIFNLGTQLMGDHWINYISIHQNRLVRCFTKSVMLEFQLETNHVEKGSIRRRVMRQFDRKYVL